MKSVQERHKPSTSQTFQHAQNEYLMMKGVLLKIQNIKRSRRKYKTVLTILEKKNNENIHQRAVVK